ncbi:MAG: NAD(P)-binding protein [Candidatus Tumulicola sp.]
MQSSVDVLIIGAGPCGLGVAWRIGQLRRSGATQASFLVVDAGKHVGGSAASVTTEEGFTFDYGGHILYPHEKYETFATLLTELVTDWHDSTPVRGVWMDGRLIPYPVQQNIHRLTSTKMLVSLAGLFQTGFARAIHGNGCAMGADLHGYLRARFGAGLTNTVLGPLNRKMWATELRSIDNCWTAQRSGSSTQNVAGSDIRKILRSMITRRDNVGWAKTARVRYPLRGGSGLIWSNLAKRLGPDSLLLDSRVIEIDAPRRIARLANGHRVRYRSMVSTMPLDALMRALGSRYASSPLLPKLVYAQAYFVGFGLGGEQPPVLRDVHSFHIPQNDIPCWRVNVPSNFSPGNVPSRDHWSLMCEISRPRGDRFDLEAASDTIGRRLLALGLLPRRAHIVSRWQAQMRHGYPVPFLGRDAVLEQVQAELHEVGILSRGRFGGWKYEVSNQDHTFMQGVEAADYLLLDRPELTYPFPEKIN